MSKSIQKLELKQIDWFDRLWNERWFFLHKNREELTIVRDDLYKLCKAMFQEGIKAAPDPESYFERLFPRRTVYIGDEPRVDAQKMFMYEEVQNMLGITYSALKKRMRKRGIVGQPYQDRTDRNGQIKLHITANELSRLRSRTWRR